MSGAGYMSNRGRQNVASYLALDLGIDWRLGADWFESVLTDYGACSWAACVLCMCRSRRVTCAGRIACTYSQRCASAFPVTTKCSKQSSWNLQPVEVSLTLHARADVCSNWGNWCAAAGMTGGRVNKFNITKQSKVCGPVKCCAAEWCSRLGVLTEAIAIATHVLHFVLLKQVAGDRAMP